MTQETWDAFICHSTSDKEGLVLPLAQGLKQAGFKIWLDDWCLEVGVSPSQSIGAGLRNSRYGIVILSRAFFAGNWPRREMARESASARVILPVWYQISVDDVKENEPLLADQVAAKSEEGIPAIVDRLTRVLRLGQSVSKPTPGAGYNSGEMPITWDTLTEFTQRVYPGLGIDRFWQTRLLADMDLETYRVIADIERAGRRAHGAVQAYQTENPSVFRTGTDYITKSPGLVDLCFRSRHSWAPETVKAFNQFAAKVAWA
jgi:hypothetical protein